MYAKLQKTVQSVAYSLIFPRQFPRHQQKSFCSFKINNMNASLFRAFLCAVSLLALLTGAVAQPASPLGKSGKAYFHFTGTIGKIPVTMDLIQEQAVYNTTPGIYDFKGHYYYNRMESPLMVYGYMDEKKNLVLMESESGNYEYTGFFTGRKEADGTFSGVWMNGDSTRNLKFILKESYPEGTVNFDLITFLDSIKLKPSLGPDGPAATFGQSWLVPKTKDAATTQFLQNEIRNGMIGDSLAKLHKDIPKIFKLLKEDFFKRYHEEVDGALAEVEADSSMMHFLNYEEASEALITYNQNNRLTIGYFSYSYYGGAHGMYATGYVSYDVKNKKRLTLKDVFKPGYEAKMGPILERAFRRQFKLQASQPLSEILFDDTIALTDNFGLTGKGIFFSYVPYEIAAYAAGDIQVYIPFTEIADLLQAAFIQK